MRRIAPSPPANAITRFDDLYRRALRTKLARRAKPRQPGSHNHDIRPLTHREGYSTWLGVYSILVILGRARHRRPGSIRTSKD